MIRGPKPKMPRQRPPLSKRQIADLAKWIDDGVPWPARITLAAAQKGGTDWWSARPLVRPGVPVSSKQSSVVNPIDAFILAKLVAKKLMPTGPVDRLTYIRRATFDLHGLPPTPKEIDAFVNDSRPDAYERVIDRLLASPRYGERWARHWLDICHYADTHGYDKDKRRLWAWWFRDWVIRALNRDMPYRRFVSLQLAGDVLEPDDSEGAIATGFVVAGPWDFVGHVELREGAVEKEKTRSLDRDDMVANAVSSFCSVTVHCARCHDHKFDPISQRDYYRLQAVFAGVERGDRFRKGSSTEKFYAVLPVKPRPIHLLHRGDVEQKGELVSPGALSLVKSLNPVFDLKNLDDEGARRVALAEWVVDDRNPLTWRSIVNRIWQYHFGRGLVDTPNDFGRNGALPTHPELLDWLAVEFRDGGGSFKKLHRLIMLSRTYQQSCRNHSENSRIDADNRFLWRMNRQRLDAESVRDSVLSVSGQLDLTMGGPGFELFRFKDDHSPVYDHNAVEKINDPRTFRRTIYRFTVRSVPNPFLESLDCADPNVNVPVRNTTITALQALAQLNNPFMVKQSGYFALRLRKVSDIPERQIDAAYRLAFGRLPSAEEREMMVAFARRHGLENACRVLFNANEFLFVD
jgi:hypothetical protein